MTKIFATDWKAAAYRVITCMRMLFIITMVWEFFLTVVIETSQRAVVLTTIGIAFKPVIIGVWLICLLGIITVVMFSAFNINIEKKLCATLAYTFLAGMLSVYISLFVLSIAAGTVVWPVVISFATSAFFIAALMYFRKQLSILEKADMV